MEIRIQDAMTLELIKPQRVLINLEKRKCQHK